MENGSSAWVAVALFLSIASCALAALAYFRSGGRSDLDAVRRRQELVLAELARHVRSGLEHTAARAARAQHRLGELRKDAATTLQSAVDALEREADDIELAAQRALENLNDELTAGAQATQDALEKRIGHVEGSIRVLTARAEIHAAEGLADAGEFIEAEDLLEDAVVRVREAKMRFADEGREEAAFGPVIVGLQEAIRSVRTRAIDHRRQIDSLLSASDSLLASLRAPERAALA